MFLAISIGNDVDVVLPDERQVVNWKVNQRYPFISHLPQPACTPGSENRLRMEILKVA